VEATLLEGNFTTGSPTTLRKRSSKIQRKQKGSKERTSVPRHPVSSQEQRARRRLVLRRGGGEAAGVFQSHAFMLTVGNFVSVAS
jgi:hypothetical protein